MSRNENARFALSATESMSRSTFDRSHSIKTTFDVSEVIPFDVIEVLPGDTINLDTSKVVRLQPLVAPIYDNIYLDTYWFFVPNRLVWTHWRELMGENTDSAWAPTVEYSVPQVTAPADTGWTKGTIADYMGIPTGVAGLSVNALPFRGYAMIMNEWFRDQNVTDPIYFPVDDADVVGANTGDDINSLYKGAQPFKAAKYHDYFTSTLPAPQKGADVALPLGVFAPVGTRNDSHAFAGSKSLTWNIDGLSDGNRYDVGLSVLTGGSVIATVDKNSGRHDETADVRILPNNLYADLSNATGATINELRTAFQVQKLLEKDALGGSRYTELIRQHFGTTSPDARLQRPEYLGGNRIPLNINQVLQTSQTDTTPLGTTGAYSHTVDYNGDFEKSFTEHGFVFGLMVARYDHSYQQGLNRMWSRKDRYDYYWPVFANLGNMAVLNKEIYAQNTSADDEVFGYQEAYADYRYAPSIVTGEMRSNVHDSLDAWHLADNYDSLPTLSDGWIREDKSNVDRALMVSSSVTNQLFADIYVKNKHTRVMPYFSIPGLIDHH